VASDVFVHQQAICESSQVGAGTRVWAFAHVLPGARIGRDCNICDGVFIENDVAVGDRVTVKCGVQLWDGIVVEDDVFIGPNATFTNDPFPRSRQWRDEHPATVVRQGASIGANATILPGVEIGMGAMVGAGAVVTGSVPPHAIVMGNPARIVAYTSDNEVLRAEAVTVGDEPGRTAVGVGDAFIQRFQQHGDVRGLLTAGSFASDAIGFAPRRWFLVYDVPGREVRGEHAHRTCHQFLICVAGSVNVALDDGEHRRNVELSDPTTGLYVPPMVWTTQYRHEPGSTLLVFASDEYDAGDYIRDYSEFVAERASKRS
jgi:acetyltransferase-like isoleucine patch superfamily enzyme/dTDP-4-dehydrorhamnose 3,5-epimerase-like enzyme